MPYAIRNRKTKKWVYGTDYRYGYPRNQRTSFTECLVFSTYEDAKHNFIQRDCSSDYRIVPVKIVEESEATNETDN